MSPGCDRRGQVTRTVLCWGSGFENRADLLGGNMTKPRHTDEVSKLQAQQYRALRLHYTKEKPICSLHAATFFDFFSLSLKT